MSLDKQVSPSRAQCVCSTVGFENAQWNARYYPENCPEDWRLAYFMNDFRVVYLPCTGWYESAAQITAIADEMDEDFELIIQWPPRVEADDVDEILARLEPLRQNIACIVLSIDDISEAVLDAVCGTVSKDYVVNLSSRILDSKAQRELALQYDAGFVWFPVLSEAPVLCGQYQVVCLPCQGLREMKTVLDKLHPIVDRDIRAGLFFEPAEQSVNRAIEVRTLIELMGF